MSDTSFRSYRMGQDHADQRKADGIDQPATSNRSRFGGIFNAINENLKAKDQISYQAQEQRKTAKELAESYKKGSTKISDDATVVEGYQDPGYTIPGQQGRSFGGLIGTVAGAALGGPLGVGAMTGAQLGGRVGSYF